MAHLLQPLGPSDPDLGALPPERFEELVFLLAHADDQDVVPVRAKDHGLDARLPAGDGRTTARGWQAKRFTSGIKWDQCRASVRRALAFWRPPHITFCFAHDLSAREQESFRTELLDRFPELKLDYWSGSELKRRMRSSEEGRIAARYLFGDPEADLEAMRRALATGGELNSAGQALARLGVINEFIQRDPHFQYQIGFGEVGAPKSDPAPETVISVELEIEGISVRLDASERYPGAAVEHGPKGALVFDDEESARSARAIMERLEQEGGSASLEGARLRMDQLPSGLMDFAPGDSAGLEVQVVAQPSRKSSQRTVPILAVSGDREAAIDLIGVKPPAGWRDALSGGFGGLEILLLLRPSATKPGRTESKMTWNHNLGIGSTIEQLIALQVVKAVCEGQPLSLKDPVRDNVLTEGAVAEDVSGSFDGIEGRLSLLRLLAELEAWTGARFAPPPTWSEGDAESLFAALELIREPVLEDVENIRIKLTYKPEAMPEDVESAHQFAMFQPLSVRLFGQEVELGQRLIHLPRGRLTEIDRTTREAVVVPDHGQTGSVRILAPGEERPVDRGD